MFMSEEPEISFNAARKLLKKHTDFQVTREAVNLFREELEQFGKEAVEKALSSTEKATLDRYAVRNGVRQILKEREREV